MPLDLAITVIVITIGALLISIRLVYVIWTTGKPLKATGNASKSFTTLIVLGSGGHTAAMLNLLSVLQKDLFASRFYIAAATDNMSLQKARVFESFSPDEVNGRDKVAESLQFMQIYQSREVGQSYITSVWTTLFAMAHGVLLVIRIRPEVSLSTFGKSHILCNGPGTCVPLCVIAFFFKIIGVRWSSIFYVESIARVQRLSLSGLILYKLRIADQFFVKWPQLKRKYPRAHDVGCLM